MVETAAHLTDHVFPRLPVRQWVLSVPKRLRYYMQRDGAVLNMVLRIFLRVIEQSLSANCPGAVSADKAALHIGAIAFIHRSNSSLNGHVHFHVCAVDGVFEEVAGDTDAQSSPPGIVFHPASGVDATVVALVQADLRRRILRAFVGRGLLESCDAKEILTYQHSGFSVDAGVRIESHDRAALERLLRYCARPPFACGRLRKEGAELVYRCAKQHSEPAPAQPAKQVAVQTEPTATGEGAPGVTPLGHASPPMPEPAKPKRSKAHYLWAVLIARIFEVFPLLCPLCGGQVRLIAFITEGTRESGRSLITSGWTPSPRTLPRHADHRCGMTATRRRMRGCALSPIGVWRRNRHRTLRSISASVGEWLRRRF
jgi:hypothetical protein